MATATLDKAGRVLIPKALRETLGLEPGDAVELDNQGDQVTLRPVRASAGLHKEQGIWVFRRGRRRKLKARDTDAVLHALRVIRDRDQFGSHD